MKYWLAEEHVGHSLDFGNNETYLVHILNPGVYVLGFDIYVANTNDRVLQIQL